MVDKLKNAHTLISEYQRLYAEKYGEKPVLNRNKLKYSLADILIDMTLVQVKELLAFYIKTETDPSLNKFCYEYAELWHAMREHERDANERKRLLHETEKRTREFRERYAK